MRVLVDRICEHPALLKAAHLSVGQHDTAARHIDPDRSQALARLIVAHARIGASGGARGAGLGRMEAIQGAVVQLEYAVLHVYLALNPQVAEVDSRRCACAKREDGRVNARDGEPPARSSHCALPLGGGSGTAPPNRCQEARLPLDPHHAGRSAVVEDEPIKRAGARRNLDGDGPPGHVARP